MNIVIEAIVKAVKLQSTHDVALMLDIVEYLRAHQDWVLLDACFGGGITDEGVEVTLYLQKSPFSG